MPLPHWIGDDAEFHFDIVSEDAERILLRGSHTAGGSKSFLIVGPATGRSPQELIARLTNEYSLRSHLDDSWAVRPKRLENRKGVSTLVLEDPGGEGLTNLIGDPADIRSFLVIAIAISDAIASMHEAGLLHKDIKPSNIVVSSKGDHVWLTGFGIASRLPRERQTLVPPSIIAGTFAYMAPEQTGRMNRSIDTRSDLYAFGVTLYQFLTGALPFFASDPIEWIHCQVARQAMSPSEKLSGTIPGALSDIIMKLLSKAAEDRYQTAAGLASDLRRCLTEWEAHGTISSFHLGSQDTPNRLNFREQLYGRESALNILIAAYDRVISSGLPELILVSGQSGSGKSSIVEELHRSIVSRHGFYAAGKFDQYKRGIPYATLSQAFQELLRQLLSKDEMELARWCTDLTQALGSNGQLIVNLVPELKQFIGEQPAVADLSGPEAQNRLRLVLGKFIGVFARPEHPLVLFFDDLQWLDSATLDVFEALATQAEVGSLLLVGAYRDNEVGADHLLSRRLSAIRGAGVPVQQILLEGIGTQDIARMIADALYDQADRIYRLASIVFEKTGGNPFFTTQFVAALVDEGLLFFDPEVLRWNWDIERISRKHVSESVVELMIERLTRLSDASRQALKLLACMGNQVKASTFRHIVDLSDEETQALLHEGMSANLLLQIDDKYAFAHDRVHEAAYASIPEHEKGPIHRLIGLQLLSALTELEIDADLFDIVNQLNRAGIGNIEFADRVTVASLNLRAGRRAKASAAYSAACGYLAQGRAQLGEAGWQTHSDLAFALAIDHAECTFLNGDLAKTEHMISALLGQEINNINKAAIYRLKIQLCVVKSDNIGAVKSGLEGLKLLGLELPRDPTWEDVQHEYDQIWRNLDGRPIESFVDLPAMTDKQALEAMCLLAEMQPPAYFSNFNTTILVICKMVNLCLTRGASRNSAQGLVLLGYVIGPAFGRYQDGYHIARLASKLAVERNGASEIARVKHLTGLAAAWTEPLPLALDWLRSAFHEGVEAGDLYYACFEAAVIVLHVFLSGQKLDDVDEECKQALDFARDTGFQAGIDLIIATERAVASLQGRTSGLSDYSDGSFNANIFEYDLERSQNSVVTWWYWTRKTMVHFLAGEYEAAISAAERVQSQRSIKNMQIEQMDCLYYTGLSIAALFNEAPAASRAGMRVKLTSYHAQLRRWAKKTRSQTFEDKHLLIAAEIARIDGQDLKAQQLYESSIRLAQENGFVQNEAVSNEVASRYYQSRGFEKISHMYLRDASQCYQRWGAHAKVQQLEKTSPHIRKQDAPALASSTTIAQVDQFDLATVIKVAQAVSGEIVLEKLLDALMRTTIEHAAAGRAVLVLLRDTVPHVEAEAEMTGKGVVVRLRENLSALAIPLPDAVVQHVLATKETVILDNASLGSPFSDDIYVRQRQVRSLLALPLVNQGRIIGLLYLENNLAASVFTSSQISLLKLVASHATFALENTRLYRDLAGRDARIRRLVDSNIIGVFMWKFDGAIFEANDSFLNMLGYDRDDLVAGRVKWSALSPPESWEVDHKIEADLRTSGRARPWEKELLHKDGRRVPVLLGAAAFGWPEADGGATFTLDLSARKQAEEAARESDRNNRELQSELAHANRVATIGQLSAAISHELRQPLVGIVTSGSAGLNWLEADPPNIESARKALERVVSEGHRAANVLERTRALVKKAPPRTELVDLNTIISETVTLIRAEAVKTDVSIKVKLEHPLPPILADRVQVQQVVLNLAVNAIEAMTGNAQGESRELTIVSGTEGESGVFVSVHDTGPGVPEKVRGKVFEAFYSTKSHGMGMGLAISKTIATRQGGRLWITANEPRGAVFWFSLKAQREDSDATGKV